MQVLYLIYSERLLAWMVRRWTHCLEPPGATLRNSVWPSPYRPGSAITRTFLTVNLPCPTLFITQFVQRMVSKRSADVRIMQHNVWGQMAVLVIDSDGFCQSVA